MGAGLGSEWLQSRSADVLWTSDGDTALTMTCVGVSPSVRPVNDGVDDGESTVNLVSAQTESCY